MGSRFPSHQLSNGLYVSGLPEQHKERQPTMASKAMPYTGGDIRKSGELGKMFDIPVIDSTKLRKSGPVSVGGPSRAGSFGTAAVPSRSNSGPLASGLTGRSGPQKSKSGPLKRVSGPQSGGATPTARQKSGPLAPTGLITSGPISSGPLTSSGTPKRAPGHMESPPSVFVTMRSLGWGKKAATSFISAYPDTELRGAKNGQYVKVTGVVTCGSIPLESSYRRVSRCVYVSTALYEYRGWNAKPANPKHRRFTWGLRYVERHVTDFYISDFQSGLRALVKSGDGARVTPFVDTITVVDLTKKNRDLSPDFIRWLGERNLSSDDRVMRLKEGYIKEGSTISVMGVVQRSDNVLMIVPSPEPVSTGCQLRNFLLPCSLEGIVLRCEDTSKADVIPV